MRLAQALAALSLLIALPAAAGPTAPSATEILDRVDDLWRGDSSHGKMTMKVVTAHYTREMTLEQWTRGKDHALIRILAPRKEQGTATLKAGESIWNYLPKVKRVIKVPSSMMGGAWMGSHFTNDDLVKESRMADDYDHQTSFDGARDGVALLELTLTPKPNAAVVWGQVTVEVRKADLMPLRIRYFDEDLALARTMTFDDLKVFGGRTLPAGLRMVPADKPAEYTEFITHELEFDVTLADDLFSQRSLQQ